MIWLKWGYAFTFNCIRNYSHVYSAFSHWFGCLICSLNKREHKEGKLKENKKKACHWTLMKHPGRGFCLVFLRDLVLIAYRNTVQSAVKWGPMRPFGFKILKDPLCSYSNLALMKHCTHLLVNSSGSYTDNYCNIYIWQKLFIWIFIDIWSI